MLKYIKMVLEKVSFDKTLFEKELRKALDKISWEETNEFREWCYARFGNLKPVLDQCFSEVYRGVLV